jgi:hypothetical protein
MRRGGGVEEHFRKKMSVVQFFRRMNGTSVELSYDSATATVMDVRKGLQAKMGLAILPRIIIAGKNPDDSSLFNTYRPHTLATIHVIEKVGVPHLNPHLDAPCTSPPPSPPPPHRMMLDARWVEVDTLKCPFGDKVAGMVLQYLESKKPAPGVDAAFHDPKYRRETTTGQVVYPRIPVETTPLGSVHLDGGLWVALGVDRDHSLGRDVVSWLAAQPYEQYMYTHEVRLAAGRSPGRPFMHAPPPRLAHFVVTIEDGPESAETALLTVHLGNPDLLGSRCRSRRRMPKRLRLRRANRKDALAAALEESRDFPTGVVRSDGRHGSDGRDLLLRCLPTARVLLHKKTCHFEFVDDDVYRDSDGAGRLGMLHPFPEFVPRVFRSLEDLILTFATYIVNIPRKTGVESIAVLKPTEYVLNAIELACASDEEGAAKLESRRAARIGARVSADDSDDDDTTTDDDHCV